MRRLPLPLTFFGFLGRQKAFGFTHIRLKVGKQPRIRRTLFVPSLVPGADEFNGILRRIMKCAKPWGDMKSENIVESAELKQRKTVWRRILADPQAKKAMKRLKKSGFELAHLMPHDPRYPCWADYFAKLPFLPNEPSRRQLYPATSLRKYLPLVNVLRRFAMQAADPFCEIRVVKGDTTLLGSGSELGSDFGKTADLIERFLSSDWVTRTRNPRNTVIAMLRSAIHQRTGAPHDSELATLIDAAFIAAGKEGIALEPRALDRIQELEKEGRVKAARRLNYVSGKSPAAAPKISLSTRFAGNRTKGV